MERVHDLPSLDDAARPERTLATRLVALVGEANLDDIKRRDVKGHRLALEAYLQTIRNGVTDLSDALTARYLNHSAPSRLRPLV
jgi:hypothetical protein